MNKYVIELKQLIKDYCLSLDGKSLKRRGIDVEIKQCIIDSIPHDLPYVEKCYWI